MGARASWYFADYGNGPIIVSDRQRRRDQPQRQQLGRQPDIPNGNISVTANGNVSADSLQANTIGDQQLAAVSRRHRTAVADIIVDAVRHGFRTIWAEAYSRWRMPQVLAVSS